MVRMNGELSVAGYLDDEWITLGLVQDKDKDTFIDPEISVEREDEMGLQQMDIKDSHPYR